MPSGSLYNATCEAVLPTLPAQSIDAVICDPPFGTTACSWDAVIPFDWMWKELSRIIKPNGAIVLFGSQPFTSFLVCSKPEWFRHGWVYKKRCASNFAQAKYAPMKDHEDVLVFSASKALYYPIMEERKGSGAERAKYKYTAASRHKSGEFIGAMSGQFEEYTPELRYPGSVQEFNNRASGDRGMHPTQKPLALMEYLVKTYTKEGDTVLDFTMGSGTTGLACKNLQRSFVGIEKDEKYFKIAEERIYGKGIQSVPES